MNARKLFLGFFVLACAGCSSILEALLASDLSVYIHEPSGYYQTSAVITVGGSVYVKSNLCEYVYLSVEPGGYDNSEYLPGGSWSISAHLTEGLNTVTVYAEGTNGDTGFPASATFYLDSMKPAITFSGSYINKKFYTDQDIVFSGSVYESNKIKVCGYECSSGEWGHFVFTSGTYNWNVTLTNIQYNRSYIFEVIAEDAAGWQKTTNFTFFVTNTNT
ncbi:MAG: hypothetical protein A2Y33_09035 [Spirochaetes bacterium GWF1_51_8]|nr:MAG: hypothetical protein A2Y33_09035 [Spirochaetes bacterium GWF1_51_8]